MQGSLGFGSFLVIVLILIAAATGVGYFIIRQGYCASPPIFTTDVGAITPVAETHQESTATSSAQNEKPAARSVVQTPATTPKPPTTQKPVQTTSAVVGFSVKKVPTGTIVNAASQEETLELSVTTAPRAEDPTKLSLCWTMLDAENVSLSETDCWRLGTYGTWTAKTSADFSLAPSEAGKQRLWTHGHHQIKLRFDLVGPGSFQMADGPSASTPILGSDDTGLFDFYIPEDAQL